MKKYFFMTIVLIIAIFSLCSCSTKKATPVNITNTQEANNVISDSKLEFLINLKNFSKNNYTDTDLLSVAMRLAKEFGLQKEDISKDMYLEYISRSDLHDLIYEFSDLKLSKPIQIEDFYYLYDTKNDYYYIVPLGIELLRINSIDKITKENDIYTINCVVALNDEESNVTDTIAHNMTIKLKYTPSNKYLPYKIISSKYDENSFVIKYDLLSEKIYGKSELDSDLTATYFTPKEYQKTVLLNFAIHGYEDNYDKDGQVLVDVANELIKYYKNNPLYLKKSRLIIIPCSNPDGLYNGTSNNGFGRCNFNGIDLNRDFDANHKVFTNSRNKTLSPFSAKESRALRDLVLAEKPDIVLDFHGWLNMTIGDSSIATLFKDNLNLPHKTKFNSNCNGYFSYWASLQGANALLVEFEDDAIDIESLIDTINELL